LRVHIIESRLKITVLGELGKKFNS